MTITEFGPWYQARYRRTTSALTSMALLFSDLLAAMLSFGAGFFIINLGEGFFGTTLINFKSFVTYWPYLPVFALIFYFLKLYPGLSLAPAEEIHHFTVGSLMAHGGIILSRYIEDEDWDSISVAFILSFVFSCVIFPFCRYCMHGLLNRSLRGIPAVIYGGGATGRQVIDRLLNNRRSGYYPVLILDNDPAVGDEYAGVPVIHDTSLGPEIVRQFNIKMAIVAMPELDRSELTRLLNHSVSAFRYNVLIPNFFSVTNIWISMRDFDGILGFATTHQLKISWNLWMKRLMDLGVVIAGGIVILPLLLIIAALVKISSPGPVLYAQIRVGQKGKHFKAYKFRSMVLHADEELKKILETDPKARAEWETGHKLKDDPRITKIGKFLRRTSFDEFPQLINILKGEMSLVGPRPIVDDEIPKYGEDFNRIFSVKPGLTGLWQVSGRSDTDYSDRVSFDTYYLQSWSVWLDLWILYKTIGVVIKGKGAY